MDSLPQNFLAIRNHLLAQFPELKPQKKFPFQIIWFFLLLFGVVLSTAWIVNQIDIQGVTVASLLASLGLGLLYASLSLFTHELLHGSIIKNQKVSQFLANFGFFIFALSPELWLTWHNRVHHFHTNQPGQDPDSFGLWEHFSRFPKGLVELLLNRAPGSKHLLAWIYFPINFTNQSMTVMWYFLWKGDPKLYSSARKGVALFETLLLYSIWIFCFFYFGWKTFIFILLIPSLIANLISSSYILVQHLFCPLTEQNQPLENTLGVTTLPFIDIIHFHFSHHVEHHVFPEMNHSELPKLRAALKKAYPNSIRLMSHWKALKILLHTPRVYKDLHTLWDPRTDRTFDVTQVGRNT